MFKSGTLKYIREARKYRPWCPLASPVEDAIADQGYLLMDPLPGGSGKKFQFGLDRPGRVICCRNGWR